MSRCLRITVSVGAIKGFLRDFIQKYARKSDLEGIAQLMMDDQVKIIVCGSQENLDSFIDALYNGSTKFKIKNIEIEPFFKTKDYRDVFRVVE